MSYTFSILEGKPNYCLVSYMLEGPTCEHTDSLTIQLHRAVSQC